MNNNQKKFSMEFILSTTSHTSSISTHAQFLLALYYKTTRHSTTEYYGQNGFTGRDIQKGKSINLEMNDTEEVTERRLFGVSFPERLRISAYRPNVYNSGRVLSIRHDDPVPQFRLRA